MGNTSLSRLVGWGGKFFKSSSYTMLFPTHLSHAINNNIFPEPRMGKLFRALCKLRFMCVWGTAANLCTRMRHKDFGAKACACAALLWLNGGSCFSHTRRRAVLRSVDKSRSFSRQITKTLFRFSKQHFQRFPRNKCCGRHPKRATPTLTTYVSYVRTTYVV